MSSDSSPGPQPVGRKPFESAPRRLAEPGGGCSRMAAIGCAAAAILVGVALLAMMLKARELVVWSLSNVRTEIEQRLPDDLPETERARLSSAFEGVLEKLRSEDLDAEEFRRLQAALLEFARRREVPDREQVRRLAEELEQFVGGADGSDGGVEGDAAETAPSPVEI
ncbi:MAG: hypothetical protein R3244_11815 [Thermoanaerobaculia bacterium]|nr:hypothetical protein [Thermoanaerobaculia bacterium]